VSWLVGVVVVLLSSFVGIVEGNLLEVAYKVTNLLVAPLFGLFVMALFVRWSTSFGTYVGAVFGLATVVAINYWDWFSDVPGISFLWAMPLGLVVQVVVGAAASLAPWGIRNRGIEPGE
jgi:SSS family solute:Na+ symporter